MVDGHTMQQWTEQYWTDV